MTDLIDKLKELAAKYEAEPEIFRRTQYQLQLGGFVGANLPAIITALEREGELREALEQIRDYVAFGSSVEALEAYSIVTAALKDTQP